MTFSGSCHCGALQLRYETAVPVEGWAPRACQCTFCRKHGARNVSDPRGRWHVGGRPTRYRFALRTADFLICPTCGCYVGCALEHEGRWYGSVNVRMLDVAVPSPDTPFDYEGETAEERIRRRVARWTPTTFDG